MSQARVRPIYAASMEGADLDARWGAIQIGVGKASAAAAATEVIVQERIRAVLLFGICGVYPSEHHKQPVSLDVGDLCLVETEWFGDEGVATPDGFLSVETLGFGRTGPFAADADLTARVAAELGDVPRVTGATVSACSGNDAASAAVAARTGATVETREGAAVALACERLGVPWIELRCVSNRCGDRDESSFNIAGACALVQAAVDQVLRALDG